MGTPRLTAERSCAQHMLLSLKFLTRFSSSSRFLTNSSGSLADITLCSQSRTGKNKKVRLDVLLRFMANGETEVCGIFIQSSIAVHEGLEILNHVTRCLLFDTNSTYRRTPHIMSMCQSHAAALHTVPLILCHTLNTRGGVCCYSHY